MRTFPTEMAKLLFINHLHVGIPFPDTGHDSNHFTILQYNVIHTYPFQLGATGAFILPYKPLLSIQSALQTSSIQSFLSSLPTSPFHIFTFLHNDLAHFLDLSGLLTSMTPHTCILCITIFQPFNELIPHLLLFSCQVTPKHNSHPLSSSLICFS